MIRPPGEVGIQSPEYYPITLDEQPTPASCSRVVGDLAVTHSLADEVISLPMHPYLEDVDTQQVTDTVRAALAS